jgi:hypothetical protein
MVCTGTNNPAACQVCVQLSVKLSSDFSGLTKNREPECPASGQDFPAAIARSDDGSDHAVGRGGDDQHRHIDEMNQGRTNVRDRV